MREYRTVGSPRSGGSRGQQPPTLIHKFNMKMMMKIMMTTTTNNTTTTQPHLHRQRQRSSRKKKPAEPHAPVMTLAEAARRMGICRNWAAELEQIALTKLRREWMRLYGTEWEGTA